jgi:hypothetical protein
MDVAKILASFFQFIKTLELAGIRFLVEEYI